MSQPPPSSRGQTAAQLKADIDSGRTGDKIAFPDPGLSPLGTDDEAGGFPNSPKQVAMARAEERDRRFDRSSDPGKALGKWILPALIVLIVLAVALFYILRH